MSIHTGLGFILILIFAYLLGAKFPSFGQKALGAVGL